MLLPAAIFGLTSYFVNFNVALFVLILLGLTGIVFHQKLMKLITQKYLASKYQMINAFSQDN